MNEPLQLSTYKFYVSALTNQERADELTNLIKTTAAVERVDVNLAKRLIRLISREPLDINQFKTRLAQNKFSLQAVSLLDESAEISTLPQSTEPQTLQVCIDGMTCRSCELTVERQWKKLPGIKKVDVNCATGQAKIMVEGAAPSLNQLQQALGDDKYTVHCGSKKQRPEEAVKHKRPSFLRLVGLFALVLFLGHIFSKLGLLKPNVALGSAVSFGAVFIIGLVAASSSCIAVTGGLLLSAAAKFNARYASARALARMRPVLLFVGGRVVSYAVLGGLLGVVGSALSPSPTVTAILIILAAVYMFIMGLDMLHLAPSWLKGLLPRMPKALSHRIMDAEGKEHPAMPAALGAATFFLPCGFTQALQLYALTTGSFVISATVMLAFALGTAPALLALGWASSSLKGKFGRFFFQFSGALVIVLGLWNIQNGLTIAGYPITLPSWGKAEVTQAASSAGLGSASVPVEGGVQVARMKVGYSGYEPSQLTIRAGQPVRWEVDATDAGGCLGVLVSRQLGIQKFLEPGINVIAFTPEQPGKVQFSCSMGMFRGSFTVLPPA